MTRFLRHLSTSVLVICGTSLFASTAHAQIVAQEQGRRPIPEEKKRPPGPDVQRIQRPDREAGVPADLEYVQDVVYATVAGERDEPIELLMDVMFERDTDDQPMPVVVYIHGGGYRAGSKDDAKRILVPLAKGGYFAAAINYRLSGVAPYPAAVHDCKAAIRFIRANEAELGIDPKRIGVMGHSAGGQLAAFLAVTGDDEQLEGSVGATGVSSAVQCAVDISGPSDFAKLQELHPDLVANYLAGPADSMDERMLEASTMTHVDADDAPLFIIHGSADAVVPIEHSESLRDAYKEAGVDVRYLEVQGAGHAITSRPVYRQIAEFLDQYLRGNAASALIGPEPEQVMKRDRRRRPMPEEPEAPPGTGPDVLDRETEPEEKPTTQPDNAPADDRSASAIPSGTATPEGAACDLARAFIDVNWSLFEKVCLDARGAQYTRFLQQMERQFQAEAAADDTSPYGPRRIVRVYEARNLSKNGPASAAYAIYRFDDLQFVDVVAELHDNSESLVRTLVARKDGRWHVIPDPSSFPLLSEGLNDEPPSTEVYAARE